MEELRMYVGQRVEDAYRLMKDYYKRTGKHCFVKFNQAVLYSYDSKNTCYLKTTGKNKRQFDRYCKEELRKLRKKERLFKSRVPKLIKEYREKARGVLDEQYLDVWDSCVPIRVKDIYKGWDLKCMLELVKVLNREIPEKERFKECKELLENQGHSGMSYRLVLYSMSALHKDGLKFIDYVKSCDAAI